MSKVLPWQNNSGIIVPRFPNGMGIPNSRERVGTKSIWETVAVFSCVGKNYKLQNYFMCNHVYRKKLESTTQMALRIKC